MSRIFVPTTEWLNHAAAVVTGFPMTFASFFLTTDSTGQMAIWSQSDAEVGGSHQFLMAIANANGESTAGNRLICKSRAGSWVAANTAVSTVDISNTAYNHGCAMFASATSRIIVLNGANDDENTNSDDPNSPTLTDIGRLGDDTPNWEFDGHIAWPAMWNDALTLEEAAMLARGVSPLLVRPDKLVAFWPLFGNLSPEIDIVGGFDMTLNGTPDEGDHPAILMPAREIITFPQEAANQPIYRRRHLGFYVG